MLRQLFWDVFYKAKLLVYKIIPSRIGRLVIKDRCIWRLHDLLEAERLDALGRFYNWSPDELSECEKYFRRVLDKRR